MRCTSKKDVLRLKPAGHNVALWLKSRIFQESTTATELLRQYSSKPEPSFPGTGASYVEEQYNAWLRDPKSVNSSWDVYFRSLGGPKPKTEKLEDMTSLPCSIASDSLALKAGPSKADIQKMIEEHQAVENIIRCYQTRGHLVADIDPLQIVRHDPVERDGLWQRADETVFRQHMWFFKGERNFDQEYTLPKTTFIGNKDEKSLPFREIIARLENIYCNKIGYEFMFMTNLEHANWIRQQIEKPGAMIVPTEEKRRLLMRLARATEFESFLAKKYQSTKRFGIEGCDIMIPALKQIIDVATTFGCESIIMGMPHRGRLNTLANVCRTNLHQILAQFQYLKPDGLGGGDVKYHLGTFIERMNRATNKTVRLALIANPSHLEAVDPVVLGKTRAEQFYRGDCSGSKVMAIIMHGDAAFSGQGIVYETINLTHLPAYTTHGTIHIVANNQIGFTTDPRFSRSSRYCTDVGRVVNAPIFHVNADCPEAVYHVCKVAAEWRFKFQRDVVVDIVGYRRHGHNEADEPMFTQPLMYQKIKAHQKSLDLYAEQLISEQVMSAEEIKAYIAAYNKILEDAFELAKKETKTISAMWIDSPWSGFFEGKNRTKIPTTGICEETLVHIGKKMSSAPPNATDFVIHKGIERMLLGRKELVENRTVDWALGEGMAFGSLLKEGTHVRLSGQDVERGTFSHRHHVLHHQTIDKTTYVPLSGLYPDQARYSVCNSSLAENGVLGFEMGFAITNPNSLVVWEAQFGDFANTAQCIIDQFLSAGESKWTRQCGLVVLLPHGMEGMGPEHSSARVERFLQMSADDPDTFPEETPEFASKQLHDTNWIIANCTTPANYFHLLRRQILMPFRKPLIIMTPKSLLRHPSARSNFDEMVEGTEFRRLIHECGGPAENADKVKKLVFCSGKVYYDLVLARAAKNMDKEIAIARIEQLTPFPFDLVKKECNRFKSAELIWCQEEQKNQGPWGYVQPRITTATCGSRPICYIGRPVSATTATGSAATSQLELLAFLSDLFGSVTAEDLAPKAAAPPAKGGTPAPDAKPPAGAIKPAEPTQPEPAKK